MRLRSAAVAGVLSAFLVVVGCGGTSDQESQEERRDAFAEGRKVGVHEGEAAVEEANRARIDRARERSFAKGRKQGREEGWDEGWNANEETEEEFWDELEQEEQDEAEELAPEAESSECDPNYQLECLDPGAPDYDCLGGTGDGPLYSGYVIVVGEDHFGLDRDGNGEGCE